MAKDRDYTPNTHNSVWVYQNDTRVATVLFNGNPEAFKEKFKTVEDIKEYAPFLMRKVDPFKETELALIKKGEAVCNIKVS